MDCDLIEMFTENCTKIRSKNCFWIRRSQYKRRCQIGI